MDLYDFLVKKPSINIDSNKAYGEASDDFGMDFGIPTGTEQDDLSVPSDNGGSNEDPNMGFGFDDGEMNDGFDQGVENEEGKIVNPLDDIEDADLSLTTETRSNFATLYRDSKTNYEKLLSKNLDSSEFGSDFKEIQEQYKAVLQNIRLYLKNKYNKESIVTKIMQLNDFKMQINTLNEASNSLLEKIGVHDNEEELF